MIYGLAFVIGMFVAFIIWIINKTVSGDLLHQVIHREGYDEMKRIRRKKKNKE